MEKFNCEIKERNGYYVLIKYYPKHFKNNRELSFYKKLSTAKKKAEVFKKMFNIHTQEIKEVKR